MSNLRRNAAAQLAQGAGTGTAPVAWDPNSGQMNMGLYEYALRHPNIMRLGVLRDKFMGATNQSGGQKFLDRIGSLAQATPTRLTMEPGQDMTVARPNPVEGGGVKLPSAPDAPAAARQTFADFRSRAGKGWDLQTVKNAYLRRQGRYK